MAVDKSDDIQKKHMGDTGYNELSDIKHVFRVSHDRCTMTG